MIVLAPRPFRILIALVALLASARIGHTGLAEELGPEPDRQVTIFGVVATPDGETTDPRLLTIVDDLRRLRPNHGFELRGVKSQRLETGSTLSCDLGDGLVALARLKHGLDDRGKVQIAFTLKQPGQSDFTTSVTTPPNQLFFCEKPLPGGKATLLIGVAAR